MNLAKAMHKKQKTTHNVNTLCNLDHFCIRWYRDVWSIIEDKLLLLALRDKTVLFALRATCRHWAYHKLLYEAAMHRALESRVTDFRKLWPCTFSGLLQAFLDNDDDDCLGYTVVTNYEPSVTSEIFMNLPEPGMSVLLKLTEIMNFYEGSKVLRRHRDSALVWTNFASTWTRHVLRYYDRADKGDVKETVLDFLLDYYDNFSLYNYKCSACPILTCTLVPNTPSPDSSNKTP